MDRFEDLNKGWFLVHLIDYEVEMTKKNVRNPHPASIDVDGP
jgi:hypothetical protein